MISSRCLWPRGSTTCPTPSCWTSSPFLRGWAKWTTSTQSSSNKGPQANSARLLISALNENGVHSGNAHTSEAPAPAPNNYHCPPERRLLHGCQSLYLPKIMFGIITATFWSNRKTAWNLPCNFLPISQPWTSWSEWVSEWMDECLRTFMRCHRTCSRVI